MKKKSKRICAFLRENRQIYLFALFLTVWLGYFLSSWQERERMMMHCALDDAIPFVPAFIIPYLMWYAYVPIMLAAVCFLDKKYFPRQCAAFFGGAWACIRPSGTEPKVKVYVNAVTDSAEKSAALTQKPLDDAGKLMKDHM